MRTTIDRILQLGIKLCMLTGVAFTFAACYGPPPGRRWQNEPEFQQDQQKMEHRLQSAAEEAEEEKAE